MKKLGANCCLAWPKNGCVHVVNCTASLLEYWCYVNEGVFSVVVQFHSCYSWYSFIAKPGFDLPCHTWSLMNRFRTGQSPCHANLHKLGLVRSLFWRWAESALGSRLRCSHMAGMYSDCSTRKIIINCLYFVWMKDCHNVLLGNISSTIDNNNSCCRHFYRSGKAT